jgi:hypothetical protein
MQGAASPTAKSGGAAKSGETAANQPQPDGDPMPTPATDADSRGELASQDAAVGNLKFEGEPWFANLPPGLKAAIQAKARGKAPRGYEERLRRYFESVE